MSGNKKIVDYRFSQLIEKLLEKEFAPGAKLTVSMIAYRLNVTRTTVYLWLNGVTEISTFTVNSFIHCDDWRGWLAREVYRIYDDQMRWSLERAWKKYPKIGKYRHKMFEQYSFLKGVKNGP